MHQYSNVRPDIYQAFIRYADVMTEEDFQLNYFPTDDELLALRLSTDNAFADVSNFSEFKRRVRRGNKDLLDDDTWWKIRNDLI